MTNYDHRLWFWNKNISKSLLNQGKSFIISVNQDVVGWRNNKKEGIIQKW